MVASTFFTSLLLALGATSALAAHHHPQPRVVGGHLHGARALSPAPKPGRHDYLLQNATLATKLATRDNKGHATFYHPATEGGSQSACGKYMDDHTMGVALSIPGWSHFAKNGLSQKDLCYKPITIHGIFGNQKAQIMDQCPSDSSTKTCLDICDIDLTYGLFGMLAEHALGIFPVYWTFDDGTPSPCEGSKGLFGSSGGKSSSSSSHSSSSSSHSSSSSSSPSHHQSSSSSHSSSGAKGAEGTTKPAHHTSSAASHSHSSHASHPSHSVSASHKSSHESSEQYSITLEAWKEIDPQWCPGIHTPDNTVTAAIGPTKAYPNSKLSDVCGKWITIQNDKGKTSKAQVVEWIPDTTENFIAVGEAFHKIVGSDSANVKWSFDQSN